MSLLVRSIVCFHAGPRERAALSDEDLQTWAALATLTESGSSKVDQVAPGHVDVVNCLVFDPLTQVQARQLGGISRRIMTAIRSEEGWRPR